MQKASFLQDLVLLIFNRLISPTGFQYKTRLKNLIN